MMEEHWNSHNGGIGYKDVRNGKTDLFGTGTTTHTFYKRLEPVEDDRNLL